MSDDPLITDPDGLRELCVKLEPAARIAIDTEFVPEYTYTPTLCLIQLATDELLALVDPLAVQDLTPLWEAFVRPGREIVLHAGKEEMNFILGNAGRLPEEVFDVQLAAGFVGLGYPLAYSKLAHRLTRAHPASAETRTDWRNRPLSERQIQYALDDVRHLLPIRDKLGQMLQGLGRTSWFVDESVCFRQRILERDSNEPWRRISGAGSLSPRELAVLREIANWRDSRAKKLNKPTRWILRDDLLSDLAKRQPTSHKELQKTRGIGSIDGARWADDLIDAIKLGKEQPELHDGERSDRREGPDEQMVLKILAAAMIHIAQSNQIATTLLGTNDDLRQLIEWQADGGDPATAPRLARGWRKEICGSHLADLLSGKTHVRIQTDDKGARLVFEDGT